MDQDIEELLGDIIYLEAISNLPKPQRPFESPLQTTAEFSKNVAKKNKKAGCFFMSNPRMVDLMNNPNFDEVAFANENNIDIHTLIREPLGRWFLSVFADVTKVHQEATGKPGEQKEPEWRWDKHGVNHQYIAFAQQVSCARRQALTDDNLISKKNVLRLLEDFNMQNKMSEMLLRNNASEETHIQVTNTNKDTQTKLSTNIEPKVKVSVNADAIMDTTAVCGNINENESKNGDAHSGIDMKALLRTCTKIELDQALEQILVEGCQTMYNKLVENTLVYNAYMRLKWYTMDRYISESNLVLHRVLGKGAFGTVHGCAVDDIGTVMAVKVISKKMVMYRQALGQVLAERHALKVLSKHQSPYCMKLRYAFQHKEAFNLLLPLASGGDLKFHLETAHPKGFPVKRAKVYCVEIALGLGHLHSLGMLIRDLKPRNVILDSHGHCKISDFGLVVFLNGDCSHGQSRESDSEPDDEVEESSVVEGKDVAVDIDPGSETPSVENVVDDSGNKPREQDTAAEMKVIDSRTKQRIDSRELRHNGSSRHSSPEEYLLDSSSALKPSECMFTRKQRKFKDGKVKGRCGTEGYWSPEVIRGEYYSFDADWWSYGCCMFELITGYNPFSQSRSGLKSRDEATLHMDIRKIFPSRFPKDGRQLVERLLSRDPVKRMFYCRRLKGKRDIPAILDETKYKFWSDAKVDIIIEGIHQPHWVPEKAMVYSYQHREEPENSEVNKIKLDSGFVNVQEFEYFVDMEEHQKDILKVISSNTKISILRQKALDDDPNNVGVSFENGCGCTLQ